MKTVILAGGLGTRISEESHLRPKPMIEVGGRPILWHIMKQYSFYGFNEFIICCGYKAHVVKEYFSEYYLHCSNVTFDFANNNKMTIHSNIAEPWSVTIVDTGVHTMTGGRIKRVKEFIGNEQFMMTYGDGVSDVDINKLLEFHSGNGKLATLTAIQPKGRFGTLEIGDKNIIGSFKEKPKDNGWINAGFMVLHPDVFDYIDEDSTVFESEPLERIANNCQLSAYKHDGFWQCMDTLRDKLYLESLIESGNAPWIVWNK